MEKDVKNPIEEDKWFKPFELYFESSFRSDEEMMSELFENANRRYLVGVDTEDFIDKFMNSKVRAYRDECMPKAWNIDLETLVSYFLKVDILRSGNVLKYINRSDVEDWAFLEKKWLGLVYTKIAHRSKKHMFEVYHTFPLPFMRYAYISGHLLDPDYCVERILETWGDHLEKGKVATLEEAFGKKQK